MNQGKKTQTFWWDLMGKNLNENWHISQY